MKIIKNIYSQHHASDTNSSSLFLDIETTGLDRERSIIYMIGCGYHQAGGFRLIQWFNDDGVSEKEMLADFLRLLEEKDRTLVTYNGEGFDLPFLTKHFQMNGLKCDLPDPAFRRSSDYYRLLRPFRRLFSLKQGRQKDWEAFLGLKREDRFDGGSLIKVYKEYLRNPSRDLSDLLFLHNREDILGLSRISTLTAYPALWKGDFRVDRFSSDEDGYGLQVTCLPDRRLPVGIHWQASDDSSPLAGFETEGDHFKMTLPIRAGTLKYFYKNPKDYYYLPEEDRAIHKSVASFVERPYRKQAVPATCYVKREGLYLPAPLPAEKYGFASEGYVPGDDSNLYRKHHKDPRAFIDLDDLISASPGARRLYLTDLLNETAVRIIDDESEQVILQP